MDENRIVGMTRNVAGKVDEGVDRAASDVRTQAQGQFDQAAGFANDMYNQSADTARDTAVTLDKWLRITIETQPFIAATVALGIGWFLGRLHKPL
jgi:uncharacterized protein YjbJ (UPF0337 family)